MQVQKNKAEIRIGEFLTRAALRPDTYSKENRTVDIVISSGSRGRRSTFFGDSYYEELEISDAAVRMQRLMSGAPLLVNHNQFGNQAAIAGPVGVIESAKISDGVLIGSVRFSNNPSVDPIVKDIEDGIIRNVSVGYIVHRYLDVTTPTDDAQVLRAVDWEPMEVSLVSVPFDPAAQVRSVGAVHSATIDYQSKEGDDMPPVEEEKKEEGVEAPAGAVATEEKVTEGEKAPEGSAESVDEPATSTAEASVESGEEARAAERARTMDIITAVDKAKLERSFADQLIKEGVSVDVARARIIDAWAAKGSPALKNQITGGSYDERDVKSRGVVNALLHRYSPKLNPLTDEGRAFRGMKLIDMARECLEEAGIKTRGLVPSEIASKVLSHDLHIRAGLHGTTDFPSLLLDAANKLLRQAYEQSPRTWMPFSRVVSVPDFKNVNRIQLGEAPALAKIPEHGEVSFGTIGDAKEVYALSSYGKAVAITRQAIINDDLSGFTRVPELFGRSAANLENDIVYSILNLNANMGDGNPLFGSAHGNLGTAGAISDTTLGEMRKKGRLQTGLDGATLLNIMYEYLIVPPSLETVAQKQLGLVQPDAASNVNPFSNLYRLIVEPRLESGTVAIASSGSATAWYSAASPSQIDTIEAAYLEGFEGVRVESEVEFDTDGVKIKAMHDFAAKAIDHRGLFKNAGV